MSSPDTSHHHQPSCQLFWCHCHCQLGPLGTSVINLVQWVVIPTLDLLVRCSPQVIVQRSVHRKLGPAAHWLTASAPARHTLLPATVISALAAWCLRPFCSCRCPGQLPSSAQCHVCHLHHIGARQTAAALVAPDGWQCCAVVSGPPGLCSPPCLPQLLPDEQCWMCIYGRARGQPCTPHFLHLCSASYVQLPAWVSGPAVQALLPCQSTQPKCVPFLCRWREQRRF